MNKYTLLVATITVLFFGCVFNKDSNQDKYDFLGTTWAMHLKGESYNHIWLSCDSTYIDYDDEIENRYYGIFNIENDTLFFHQLYEDDYHKYGSYPIKKRNVSKIYYLIRNDSILELIGRDGKKANSRNIYMLKQHFDCSFQ